MILPGSNLIKGLEEDSALDFIDTAKEDFQELLVLEIKEINNQRNVSQYQIFVSL